MHETEKQQLIGENFTINNNENERKLYGRIMYTITINN